MPKYKPLYSLYKGLKENKYDVPDSYISFQKTLTQAGDAGAKSRRGLYQSLKDSNYDVPDTYEDFYKNLFVPVNSTTSRALKIGENPNTPTVNRYRQKMFDSVDPNKNGLNALSHRAVGQAVRATNNVRKPVVAKVVNRKGKPTGEEFAITPAKTVEDLDREYAQAVSKNWENELHDQMADADKDAAKISDMFKSFIGSTDEVGSVWGNMTRGGGIAGTPHSVTTNNGILENTEARQILAAGDYNRKRRELLQLEQDSRNGAIFDNHSFFRGMYDAAKDTGFLTGGASDLINAGSLLATKQDLDNGVHTEAGDMLMQQAVKNSDAQSQYGDNQGWMYTGGVITTNMAPFMVQIGSAGFSKGMSNAIGKVVQGAASKVALGTMEKATGMAGAHIANYIGKVTGLTTKAFGKAIQYGIVGAAQANTVGLGNVANDVVNRYTGQVYQDEQGNYKFGTFDSDGKLVHEGGEDFLTALVKGEAAQTIEFATELAGGGIDAAGTALKNFVTKGGKKIINKYNMENVSKVIDFLLNNKVAKNARYLKAGADRTLGKVEVNSIVGESLEEELGIIANTVFTGDNKISDLWDEKQQSQIWGGMLLSIGLMKGAVAPFHAYNAKQYYSYKHKLDKADVNLSQLLGKEKWEELRNQIDVTTNEDMPELANKINRDVALGKNRQPVREYIQNLLIMRGYDIGNMLAAKKAVEDKGEGVSVKNMEKNQAYQQGRDAYGYDTHEIQLDQEDKQKSLAQLLGISEQQLASMSDEELETLSGRDDNIDRAIYDYQLSTARYEGVIDNARDQIDLEVQRAAQAVDMYTDKSRNTIRNATIKATGGLEDYGVYIINGNIATHEDGSIDISNSDDMILYYDPTTNMVEHADAMMFAELGSEENADEVRSQAMADAKEKAIKETTGIIDGVVEVGTQFKTVDADGTEHIYEVLADNGDGTAMITIDGNIPTELVKGENVNVPVSFEELQKMKDESDQQRLQAAKAQREQMEKERAEQQMQAQTTQAENPAQESNIQSAPIEDNLDYSDIIREDGKVQMVDVSDKDGNNLFPDAKDVFYIQGNKMRTKFAYIDANGELKTQSFPTGLIKIKTRGEVSVDDYKKYRYTILSAESSVMPESSMIEDNSGENRGEIEVEAPTIEDAEPIGTGAFGNIYNQFKGKVKEAFNFLMSHKSGDLLGVFHRDDVGDIDLVWGNEKMGLAHILGKHVGEGKDFETPDDAIAMIENVINSGRIFQDNQNRYTLMLDGVGVGIRKSFDGEKKNWIVTAVDFNRSQEEKGIVTNPTSTSHGVTESESAAALNDSDGKDINNSANGNENNESLTFEDGTPIPVDVNGEVDLSQTDAAHAAEWYDTNLGEDADDYLDGEIKKAKKVLEQAKNKKLTGTKPSELVASKKEKEAAIANAQAVYDSAISIRDALKERRIAKEENTAEGRKNLIDKARRKFARLKSAVKDDAEAVAQLYKETVGTLLHRLYDGTGIDVTDTIPLTAEEYVASNLGAHTLSYEGTETSKGVKQKTGLSREDFAKTQLLAADGKGTTIDALVHSLWENRPSNLDSLDTQDIRNAMLSVITSGFKASEAKNYIENLRIAQAEKFKEEEKKAADNAAFAEENKAESEQQTETATESEEKTGEENSDEINDKENEKINEQTNENINAPEVPEDATEENPLGLQLSEDKVPFEIEGGKSGETYNINDNEDRQRLINDNKVDDKDILDIDMPKHVHKAIKELCKKMGLKVQFLYMGARSNGWIENGTMYLALDTEKATQFVFGHEMTHAIKQKNPEAYKELVKVAMAVTTKKKFEEDLAKVYQNYHGISGYNNVDDYVEEVVADNLGKFINNFDLAQKFSLRLNHPVLATILHAIQKIKSLLYGDFYKSVDALERIVEKAYVDTAKGEITNSETGEDVSFSLRQKPEPKKKGIGYKVFVLKDGKLYPPMVANPDGAATPVGVWLDADAAPIAGESKTGRPQVKQGGKGTQGGSGKLAYRPGWHLGVVPYAIQFNRKDAEGNKTLFPKNFVFAEVEYAADVDYQEEARQEGINPSGKYQHSLAGLKHLPTDGYYMYRTNPNPETDPWVITGAMKVNRILTRAEQAELVKNAGREPQQIQEGDIVTDDVVNSINQEIADAPKFSLKVYHGSGADFTEFDFDHMGEGAGSQAFGWGGYVTSSEEIGKSYVELTRKKPTYVYNGKEMSEDDLRSVLLDKVGIDNANILDDFLYNLEKYGVSEAKSILRKGDYAYFKDLLKGTYGSVRSGYQNKVDAAELILAPRNIRVKKYKGNLYEVDIPDDNGRNYLDWDAPITDELIDKVAKALPSLRSFDIKDLKKDRTFDNFYKTISMRSAKDDATFNDDKAASQLLASLGYTGIKYKAGRNFGGAEEGDTNYVIFKPEDMRITEHTKFSLKTYHGTGANFDRFDTSHAYEGAGSETFGHGIYVTKSAKIGASYALNAKVKKIKTPKAFKAIKNGDNWFGRFIDNAVRSSFAKAKKETFNRMDELIKEDENIVNGETKPEWKQNAAQKELADFDKLKSLFEGLTEEDIPSLKRAKANRYEVEIPDDTGNNYLDWNKPMKKEQKKIVREGLEKLGVDVDRLVRNGYSLDKNFGDVYNGLLYYALNGTKFEERDSFVASSNFLSSLGFTGIKYYAGTIWGGAKKGDLNYVIFNEDDAKIVGNTKFSLKKVNDAFNQRLDELVKNPNQKDKILRLGRSSSFLKAGGIADAEIELDFDKLMRKSKQGYVHEHPFDATDVKDLPMAIANPISVFDNTNGRNDGQVILTELKKEDRNFIVAIQTENQNRKGGVVLKVNKIVTLFPKDARGVINWFNQGKATNIDKEKALHFIEALQNHSGTTITDEELKSAANIINSFETTKKNGEKVDVDGTKFSLKDEEYLKAVEDGNMEKAQKMVNEAAAAAGYSTDSSYQGTSAFNGAAPWGNGYFLTKDERKEAWDNGEFEGESTLGDYINDDIDGGNLEELTNAASYRAADPMRKEAIDNIRNAIQKKAKTITMYRSVPSDVKEGSFRNGDWVTPSRAYAVDNAKLHGWGDDYNIIEQKVPVDDVWFDGNDIAEWGYGREEDYINDTDFAYKNSKNNKKLLDAVTYDDNGNVIPLSQRFNEKNKDVRFSLKDEKTMFGMHNISVDKLRKAIKQGGFAAPSMGVVDSKNGIYSDYGEITLIPKAEKLAKRTGKNAGTFTADAWTPTYPQVERIMNKQGEKAFNTDMNVKLGDVDNGIYSNVRESWKGYLSSGDVRDGLYWHYLFDKGMNPETIYQTGKYDNDITNEVMRISDNGNKTDYTDKEVAELIQLMNKATGKDNDVDAQREKLKARIASAEKQGNHLLVALKKKRLEELEGVENFYIAADFVNDVVRNNRKNGKVDVHDTMGAAKKKVEDNKKLSDDFPSWLDKKTEEYGVEEMLYNGTTPSGKPKYIPNTIDNAVKLMKKQGVAGGYTAFGSELGAFIAKNSPEVNTLAAMKNAKDKLIPFGDERHNQIKDKITKEFLELSDEIRVGSNNRYAFDDSGVSRMVELTDHKGNEKEYLKKAYNVEVSDEWMDRYNKLLDTIKKDYKVFYFETKFMRPYGLDEFEKAIVPSDTPSDVVDALKKAGIDVSSYERGNAEDRQKVTMDAINSSDNIRFSLRGSTPYDKQMEEWMEKNNLEKGAVPMEKPIMKEGENIFDYANRMVEWTRNQNLWKTAPKQTGFQDALDKWKADNGLSPDAYPPVRPHREYYSSEIGYTEDLEEYNKKKELWKSAPKPKDFDLSVDLEDMNKQLRNIRRAVLNQKNYDQRTVKAVSDLVRKILNIGWGDGLSRGKVGNLLSAAKNATGANDVKKYLDKAMGILAENYLNRLSTAYDNLINTKGARADQSGVIKMGSLDAKGQAFMSEYKKAINMDDKSLNNYIANIEEDSAKNEDNVEMNDYRLAGIQAAIMYKQQIGGNDADIAELKKQIGELKNKKDATKEDKDLLKSLEKKLFENKFDRITMYENLLNNIQRMVKESKGRAKEFREEIAEHKNEILHRANLDLEGVDSTYYDTTTAKKKLVNNDLQRAVFSSTYTFEQFLKFFGKKAANGEGYLYNYFTKLNQDALDEEQLYNEMNRNALDEKTKELFGKEKFMKLVGIDGKGMKEMDVEVTDYSNKETGKRTIHLKQGQMLYIYLVNKETDGEMKLRAMGITEEDVAAIEENLDPRVKAMGEWLQDEYLPECQRRYQATHTKYFGAPMKEVENYFPLAINNRARNVKEDVNQDSDAMSQLAGTSTGAIVTRRVNVIPLDIENADAFEVAFNHLQEMEEWSAMLPFRQDINTLLSYTHFRNQVQNMSSVAYGSGKTLWDEFKQTAQIAAGTYKPKVNAGMMDSRIAAAMGGIAVAKISGRLWTAIKQSQSATVFLPECDFTRFVKNGVNPYGSWKWAKENIPDFRKRIENITYGDVKLRQYLDELEKYHDWTKVISKWGMAPNILVDGITCAVGARSVYETEVNRLTKLGYPKEKAEEKAYYKAVAAYNKTQQSSGGMYLSPMQVDRTYVSAALSLFKNANYAYGRMQIEACRGLARTYDLWGGKHKTTLIESMTRQIMEEDGLDENTARAIAKATYNRTFRQSIGRLINFATLVPVSWALYKVLPYLLTGDDDDKKNDMIEEAVLKGFATSLSDNYVIPFASNILNAGLKVEDGKPTFDPEVFRYQNLYINPATSDLANIYSMVGNQKWYSVANKLGMLGVQSLIGFNPETVGALYQAFAEADYDNNNTAKEWQIGILKAISAPEESIRELYMDELGLKSGDIKKIPLAELEKRYAERQINRDNLLSQIGMDAETFNGYVNKYQKSFEKKIKDKMDKWDEYDKKKADEFFDTTSDPKLKDMIEKKRAKDANAAADEQIAKEGLNQEKKGKEPSEEAYDAVKMSIDVAEDNAISTYNKVLNKRYAALNDEYNNQTDAMKYIFMSKHPNFKAYKDLESEYTTYGKKMKELKEKLVSADGYDAKQTILKQIRAEREKFSELQSKVR